MTQAGLAPYFGHLLQVLPPLMLHWQISLLCHMGTLLPVAASTTDLGTQLITATTRAELPHFLVTEPYISLVTTSFLEASQLDLTS